MTCRPSRLLNVEDERACRFAVPARCIRQQHQGAAVGKAEEAVLEKEEELGADEVDDNGNGFNAEERKSPHKDAEVAENGFFLGQRIRFRGCARAALSRPLDSPGPAGAS
jgi:hypothetical protein